MQNKKCARKYKNCIFPIFAMFVIFAIFLYFLCFLFGCLFCVFMFLCFCFFAFFFFCILYFCTFPFFYFCTLVRQSIRISIQNIERWGRCGGVTQSPYPQFFSPNIPKSTLIFCQFHHLQEISQSPIYTKSVVILRFFKTNFWSYKWSRNSYTIKQMCLLDDGILLVIFVPSTLIVAASLVY